MTDPFFEKYQEIITLKWFEIYATIDSNTAFKNWCDFLASTSKRPLTDDSYHRKVLQIATGKTEGSPRHYLNKDDCYKLSEKLAQTFDWITLAMGKELPEHRKNKKYSVYRDKKHIALMSELNEMPSLHYHMELIRGLSSAADKRRLNLTMHNISGNNMAEVFESVIHSFSPSGFVLIRLAPDESLTQILGDAEIPTVLINADNRDYDFPVTGNILLHYNEKVESDLRHWIQNIPDMPSRNSQKIVVAIMCPKDSHRRDLLAFLQEVLKSEGRQPEIYFVHDYAARNAFDLWKTHPDAGAYICMSDTLAVGMKHLLLASGQSAEHRVIGFDDSNLAQQEGISSFGQNLSKIGEIAVDALYQEFQHDQRQFSKIKSELYLTLRD